MDDSAPSDSVPESPLLMNEPRSPDADERRSAARMSMSNIDLAQALRDGTLAFPDLTKEEQEACDRLDQKDSRVRTIVMGSVGGLMLVFSIVMGFVGGDDPDLKEPTATISNIIGWVYFSAWSVSFYPQVVTNFLRKSVIGMSFDYQVYNLIGFTAYSIFNCAFYYSSTIQKEYEDRHHGQKNLVQANDVFFAIHAVVLTLITLLQIAIYDRGNQKVSLFAMALSGAAVFIAVLYAILVAAGTSGGIFNGWLDYVYFLSWVKVALTLVKYIPQALMNWYRKSTDGFNIYNVILDFTGGSLSITQLILDCAATGNWDGISGDPGKFALGLVSIVFDTIYMIQHYCLYWDNNMAVWNFRQHQKLRRMRQSSTAELEGGEKVALLNLAARAEAPNGYGGDLEGGRH